MDPLKKEFVDLLKAVGWTQAEAARQLCMTSGAVNQIVNPNSPVRPSPTTLRLLKLMVAAQRPETVTARTMELKEAPRPALTEGERHLLEAVRRMPANDLPLLYAVLHAVIAAFNARPDIGSVLRKGRSSR